MARRVPQSPACEPHRACSRCHARKVQCDGKRRCGKCVEAGVLCEPRRRKSRLQELRTIELRTEWLEAEVSRLLEIDCQQIPTGTELTPNADSLVTVGRRTVAAGTPDSPATRIPQLDDNHPSPESQSVQASDIGLLALNATGELRFLGPSSGSSFLALASNHVRAVLTKPPADTARRTRHHSAEKNHAEAISRLTRAHCNELLQSYLTWIHILYPLFEPKQLSELVEDHFAKAPERLAAKNSLTSCIFFLVMALGAVNVNYRSDGARGSEKGAQPSATQFYLAAVEIMDDMKPMPTASIPLIQVVTLACIFGAYRPAGSSQWQLAGLAIRLCVELGLHCESSRPEVAQEARRRVFWVAYSIEVAIAFNMGRPPSITDEHISTHMPNPTPENILAVHMARHRRIQSQIIAKVYSAAAISADEAARDGVLLKLQASLDEWMADLPELYAQSSSLYPFEYWERFYYSSTSVLHRSSPLCASVSVQSAEKCIRASGGFIEKLHCVLSGAEVALSWMMAQGALFSGLTLLITARLHLQDLIHHAGRQFLLFDIPNWVSKCNVCLVILKERLKDDLLQKLNTQFESFGSQCQKQFLMATSELSRPSYSGTDMTPSLHSPLEPTTNAIADLGWSTQPNMMLGGGAVTAGEGNVPVGISDFPWDSVQAFNDLCSGSALDGFWEWFPQFETF